LGERDPKGPRSEKSCPYAVSAGVEEGTLARGLLVEKLRNLISRHNTLLDATPSADQIARAVTSDELVLRIVASAETAGGHRTPPVKATVNGSFNAAVGASGK